VTDLYRTVIRPALFAMTAEQAHDFTIAGLALASTSPWACREARARLQVGDPRLAQTVFGRTFANPIGLAAGLDKNGVAVEGLAALGFSHVEIGTVTGQAQPGNPQPRLFRLREDEAIINRMGFNNRGCEAMAGHLAKRFQPVGGSRRPPCVLGINLGKSKVVDNAEALSDYEASIRAVGRYADYLVVNVSSPNTPGLRDLQSEAALRPLLAGVRACVDRAANHAPLLLKIAPDLSDAAIDAAVDVALETGCDGIIATNTTITRGGLSTPVEKVTGIGAGGLSGRPVRSRSTAVLARVSRRIRAAPRQIPVIGVGGVDSAEAAWEKLTHGATLVQVYSALIYHGPGLIGAINRGLIERLAATGLSSIVAAVGRDL
jgi:dihydroorotate dehydrogenase